MESIENQELEIERANRRFYDAFESLDIREMEQVWATDQSVRCIHPGWGMRSGWPAVRDSWVVIFNNTAEIRMDVSEVEIVIQQDMAWVTCAEKATTKIDGEPHSSRILATNLFVRKGRGWLMIHHHGSPMFTP